MNKDAAEQLNDIYQQLIEIIQTNNLDPFIVVCDFVYCLDKARSARKTKTCKKSTMTYDR